MMSVERGLAASMLAFAVTAALLAAEPSAGAAAVIRPDAPVRGRLSLSAGAAVRDSLQNDGVLQVHYGGLAPTQLRLSAAWFFGRTPFGVAVDGGAEWYRATGADVSGNPVQLGQSALRASVAAAGRLRFASVFTLEGQLGYGFGQLPVVSAAGEAVIAGKINHHGPMLAALFAYDGGGLLAASLRGRAAPLALGAGFAFADGAAAPSGSVGVSEYGAGAEVAVGRFNVGAFQVSPLVDYELSVTQASKQSYTLSFAAHRFGLGLKVGLPDTSAPPPAPTGPGRIRGRVLLPDGVAPGAAATVQVVGGPSLVADARGAFELPAAGPGPVTLRATAAGYGPVELALEVPAGGEAEASLVLSRPTGPGRIRGVARVSGGKGPAANVPIQASGRGVISGADGAFVLAGVGPGPVKVTVNAPGFQPYEELVSVPPGAEATLEVTLIKAGAQKALATLRGLVRSTRGAPVQAAVKIREASASTKAGADGRFLIRIPGGRYTVQIEAKGFISQTKSVDVGDGDQAIFHCDLEPAAP